MKGSIYLSVATLIFTIILLILFLYKRKLDKPENRLFNKMIILSIVSIISELLIAFTINIKLVNEIFQKLFLIFIIVWLTEFLAYTYIVTRPNLSNLFGKITSENRKIYIILRLCTSLFILGIIYLPLYIHNDGVNIYTYGPSVKAVYFVSLLYMTMMMFFLLDNLKKTRKFKNKNIIPIIFLILFMGIAAIIQKIMPGMLLTNFIFGIVVFIMYHTIENPDLKMIESLNVSKSEAERANMAKSDFLASMSHEIRTPLNAITGFSHAILGVENLPQEATDYANDIIKSSDTLLEIVGGVLDVSKIESNKMEIVEVLYNPKEEFENLAKIAKSRIGEKPIIFNYKIAEDVPYQLYGDRANIKKIVTNLLTNAVKYTAKGQIFFNVKCINKNDISYLIISVQDTGIGIKDEHISKLFTKFERLDVEKNTTTEGTGLGLAITKKLVELMGGKINVKSQYGVGSIFMTQIPQRIAMMSKPLTDTQILSTLELKRKREAEEANINGQRILIVDDNALNIKVAKIALKNFHLVLDEVTSGEECLEKIKSGEKYDLILMDIMMPGMGGEDTFIELKKITGFNTPVIALTADAISGAKEKYLAQGFTSYISKPFSPEEIKSELAKIFK